MWERRNLYWDGAQVVSGDYTNTLGAQPARKTINKSRDVMCAIAHCTITGEQPYGACGGMFIVVRRYSGTIHNKFVIFS